MLDGIYNAAYLFNRRFGYCRQLEYLHKEQFCGDASRHLHRNGGDFCWGGSGYRRIAIAKYHRQIVATAQTLGVKYSDTVWSSKFTWANYVHADFSGDDTYGGTTMSISIHDATGYNVPATAIMLVARLGVNWNAGSSDDYVSISNTSDTDMKMLRIDYNSQASTDLMHQQGFVVPAEGKILLEITDSSDVNLDLNFIGYITS